MSKIDEALDILKQLGVPTQQQNERSGLTLLALLDIVVFYNESTSTLFLIEAVTSHGPVSPKRQIELEHTLKKCKARKVYISAFPNFPEFKRHLNDIAWETEVWIAVNPGHMIHFNGPKFLQVYTRE